jgi:glycosyl-4,4'-diaponeurosporenoate acyltransferase
MKAAIWAANILGWLVIHLAVAKIALTLPARYFVNDSLLFAPRAWEHDGDFYRRRLSIRSWKGRLPNGAPWLGGFSKERFANRDGRYVQQFIVETRRAEFAHWCMLLCLPVFFLWNPPWACGVLTVYALAANAPCIAAQRYNRNVLTRVKARAGKAKIQV